MKQLVAAQQPFIKGLTYNTTTVNNSFTDKWGVGKKSSIFQLIVPFLEPAWFVIYSN